MLASSILKKKRKVLFSVEANDSIEQCVELLSQARIGALLVIEQGELLGIITERDILKGLRKLKEELLHGTAEDIMTPRIDLVTGELSDTADALLERMTLCRIRHIPIIDNDCVAGIISLGDLVKAQLDEALTENQGLREYMIGVY